MSTRASVTLSGARGARASWLGRLVARAAARELCAFVVPGPEVARASGLDLRAVGLGFSSTPRHANVLVVVGRLPEGLRDAATVAYSQMPRPRAVLAVGSQDVSLLPGPDVSVGLDQGALNDGVAKLRRLFAEDAFDPEAKGFGTDALRSRTQYTCSMHPEIVQDEPGTCPKCGMDLIPRETAENNETGDADHEGVNHDHGHAEHGDMGHGGHGDMEHGDMGFMSMVEMTRRTPRSSDGLQMEWVETPFGPLFPGLPGGLSLTFTLDGDTVAEAEAASSVGIRMQEDLTGPVEDFVEYLAGFDPLSSFSYRLLALRAVESATGTGVEADIELARVGALERERAASHLNWLAGFGYLIGYAWLARRAEDLQLALMRADAERTANVRAEVRKLARRVERTPLLRRKLAGVGKTSNLQGATGPVARADGRRIDARVDEKFYRSLGFEPVVVEGGDALARLLARLAETERSLELAEKAGSASVSGAVPEASTSGRGTAIVETPRGTATLAVTLERGEVTFADLQAPSTRHMGLVKPVTEQQELGDALAGVASLDLSPWEVVR